MILWLRHRCEEMRVGMMFLTRLPMGRVKRIINLSATSWSWPLAGLVVGLIFGGTFWCADRIGLGTEVSLVLAMAASLLVTGGLHEDGLADLADGIGGGADPSRRLAIMRDSRLGSYGAMALIFAFGLSILLWSDQPEGRILPLAIALGMASRMALPLWGAIFPNARSDGLGHAARQGMDPLRITLALTIGATGLLLSLPWQEAGLVALSCLVTQALLCLWAKRHLGGITGDVLGASQVLGHLVALLSLSGQ